MELDTEPYFYKKGNSYISKPQICGSFSLEREREATNRKYVPDCSQLKFLHEGIPTSGIRYDLNYNAETTVTRNSPEQDVGFLCHFLKGNKSSIDIFDSSEISLNDAPFVVTGGALRMIGSFPYKRIDDLYISVSLFRGVIYLLDLNEKRLEMTERDKVTYGWGHKFKQHVLADNCKTQPDIESPLIEDSEFYLVHEAELGKHRLLYATNVDAVICKKSDKICKEEQTVDTLKDLEFVQIKINHHLQKSWALDMFMKTKSLSWWLEAYFTGIDTILCGHRTGDGVVTELKFYKISDLCTKYNKFWTPNVSMNFCDVFLSYVKKCLSKELCKRHGECSKNIRDLPKIDMIFEKPPSRNVRVCDDVKHASIIPEWFGDLFTKK